MASQLGHLAGRLADGGRGRVELLAGEEIVVERGRRERCAGVVQVSNVSYFVKCDDMG